MVALPDHLVEKVSKQEVFSREDVPTEERIWATFVYDSASSFQAFGESLDHSHETVH